MYSSFALLLVMKRWWCKNVSAQLAYSLFSGDSPKNWWSLVTVRHRNSPQIAPAWQRTYICVLILHNINTQLKYTNTQLQIHRYEYTNSSRETAKLYLRANVALHCSEGHIFTEYWWDCRKYANTYTAQDIWWWDTVMSQTPSKKGFTKLQENVQINIQHCVLWTLDRLADASKDETNHESEFLL